MTPATTYRVVGVRHGGMWVLLVDKLTLERAEYVRNAQIDLIAFHEIVVEEDGDTPNAVPLWGS